MLLSTPARLSIGSVWYATVKIGLGLAFNEDGRTFRRSAVAHYVSSSKSPKPENVGGRSGKRRLQTQKKKKK